MVKFGVGSQIIVSGAKGGPQALMWVIAEDDTHWLCAEKVEDVPQKVSMKLSKQWVKDTFAKFGVTVDE